MRLAAATACSMASLSTGASADSDSNGVDALCVSENIVSVSETNAEAVTDGVDGASSMEIDVDIITDPNSATLLNLTTISPSPTATTLTTVTNSTVKTQSLSIALEILTKALQSTQSKPFISLRNDFPKNNQISSSINSDTTEIEKSTENENKKIDRNENENITENDNEVNEKEVKGDGKDEWTSRNDALVILASQQIGENVYLHLCILDLCTTEFIYTSKCIINVCLCMYEWSSDMMLLLFWPVNK
jgi:hypothetical protein